mmetsp:Transcript_55840/g.92788  ORF Transcript_55840/g.92788 Transcript_55840/m.92788 type:complete len:249 (-) Transcript_55840:545-1291(-)
MSRRRASLAVPDSALECGRTMERSRGHAHGAAAGPGPSAANRSRNCSHATLGSCRRAIRWHPLRARLDRLGLSPMHSSDIPEQFLSCSSCSSGHPPKSSFCPSEAVNPWTSSKCTQSNRRVSSPGGNCRGPSQWILRWDSCSVRRFVKERNRAQVPSGESGTFWRCNPLQTRDNVVSASKYCKSCSMNVCSVCGLWNSRCRAVRFCSDWASAGPRRPLTIWNSRVLQGEASDMRATTAGALRQLGPTT